MTTLIAKFFAPVLIGIALGVAGVVGIQKATKQEIKLECPPPIVNLKCPDAVNTIDFDKIKGFKGNITLDQHYHVQMNGDSMIVKKIITEMENKLNQLRLAKCK
jgi:hypothetical protein